MPYVDGHYVPWSTPAINGTQGYTGIINTIIQNIPWFFTFILAIVYLVLLIVTLQQKGRKKYVFITFIGMLTSMIFELFGLVPITTTGATVGMWLITTLVVVAGNE